MSPAICTLTITNFLFFSFSVLMFVKAMEPKPGANMILMGQECLMYPQLLTSAILCAISLANGQRLSRTNRFVAQVGMLYGVLPTFALIAYSVL